ncbi:MAG: spermidine/putrescine transport system substrate-binding protein [Planctomycetota bacterium]|jgi:spermidine/putrescine transport system substrate-binding protein
MHTSLLKKAAVFAASAVFSTSVFAAGELNFYNWVDYTPPELLVKFEKETGIKVNIDTYDSNETLLAKLKSGATGYDVVVPSQNFVTIMISEGMLEKANIKGMPNYKNVDNRWKNPPWDPNQEYTAPYQMGTTSFSINMDGYDGPGDSLREFFSPNASVSGKVQVFRTPDEVIPLALMLLGLDQCNESPQDMRKVQNLLLGQKQHVKVYNSETMIANLSSGEILVSSHWDGYSMKNRLENGPKQLKYVHPKEGIIGWFDSLVIPKGAPNKANAEKFINFMMDAENGANISNSARYASPLDAKAIAPFIDPALGTAPEINIDPSIPVHFSQTCSQKSIKLYDRVWTKVLQ